MKYIQLRDLETDKLYPITRWEAIEEKPSGILTEQQIQNKTASLSRNLHTLNASEYGTIFPANPVIGQIFYKIEEENNG